MSFFCDQCGREMDRRMERCPYCGAVNHYAVQKVPRTIAELRDFAAGQGLPLDKMRVFLGINYTEPKAYGIYQDADGMFVVYKNKADGTRAVRYHGPDEAHAVNELYQKMLQEMEQQRSRGAARPFTSAAPARNLGTSPRPQTTKYRSKPTAGRVIKIILLSVFAVFAAWCILRYLWQLPSQGYYMVDNVCYYYQDDSWYYYDDVYDDWYYYGDGTPYSDGSYSDYYYGTDYDTYYGASDFYFTDYYDDSSYISSDNDSDSSWDDDDDYYDSYDYSSWSDSGSDWDSDW